MHGQIFHVIFLRGDSCSGGDNNFFVFLVQIQEIEFMWLGNEKREVDPRSELINGGNYGRIFLFLFSFSQFLSIGEGQIFSAVKLFHRIHSTLQFSIISTAGTLVVLTV